MVLTKHSHIEEPNWFFPDICIPETDVLQSILHFDTGQYNCSSWFDLVNGSVLPRRGRASAAIFQISRHRLCWIISFPILFQSHWTWVLFLLNLLSWYVDFTEKLPFLSGTQKNLSSSAEIVILISNIAAADWLSKNLLTTLSFQVLVEL